MELRLPVGPVKPSGDATSPGYDLVGLPYRYGDKRSPLDPTTGWYALLSASDLAVLRSPDGFEADDDADVVGGSFGARGGYRFGEYVGIEALFDTGSQSVAGRLDGIPETYDLTTRRLRWQRTGAARRQEHSFLRNLRSRRGLAPLDDGGSGVQRHEQLLRTRAGSAAQRRARSARRRRADLHRRREQHARWRYA